VPDSFASQSGASSFRRLPDRHHSLAVSHTAEPLVDTSFRERRKYPSFILRVGLRRCGAKSKGSSSEETVSAAVVSSRGQPLIALNRYFELKGQSSNRSLQYFHVLHSSIWPARMRRRDQFVLQATLYAQASETSGCQALLICQRPRLSPPSPIAPGRCRDSCVTIQSAT
jgi:hypothetical protein